MVAAGVSVAVDVAVVSAAVDAPDALDVFVVLGASAVQAVSAAEAAFGNPPDILKALQGANMHVIARSTRCVVGRVFCEPRAPVVDMIWKMPGSCGHGVNSL